MGEQVLLKQMNDLLVTGLKVYEVEKQLGYAEGTARRKLVDAGYKYSRKYKKYITKDNEPKPQQQAISNAIISQVETVVTPPLPITPVINNQMQEHGQARQFTMDQIETLHQMIAQHQLKEKIQANATKDKGKTINRNVRVYESQFNNFADWCKANSVIQSDAIYLAIEMLMNSYK